MDCGLILRDDVAERYLRHELNDAEQSAYEQHLFECSRCADELTRLQALRLALMDNPPMGDSHAASSHTGLGYSRPALAAIALAASIAALVLLLRPNSQSGQIAQGPGRPSVPTAAPESPSVSTPPSQALPPQPPVASAPRESKTDAPRSDTSDTLRRLARIQPPTYRPLVLRGMTDEATQRFNDGMKQYQAGNYAEAAEELAKAANFDPTRPDISLFLGVSRLLAGNTTGGISELLRTIEMGESAFLADAHFYLAKGYIALGQLDSAREHLRLASTSPGDRQGLAESMLIDLESLAPP